MKHLNRSVIVSFVGVLGLMLAAGCETAPKGQVAKENLRDEAHTTLREMQRLDPSLQDFLKHNAYGYAVFPSIGKGGVLVGGAFGRGVVYQGDRFVGWGELSQGSIGLQLGGETFAEVVVFKDQETFQEWQHKGEWSAGANASAVALKAGAARGASFYDGVAYLVRPNGGLMFDLSIQGQKFNFKAAGDSSTTTSRETSDVKNTSSAGTSSSKTTVTDSNGNQSTTETKTTNDNGTIHDHQSQVGQRSPNGNNND